MTDILLDIDQALDGQRDIELDTMIQVLFGDRVAGLKELPDNQVSGHVHMRVRVGGRFSEYACACKTNARCEDIDKKLDIFGDAYDNDAPALSVAYRAGLSGLSVRETMKQLDYHGYDNTEFDALFLSPYHDGLAEAEQITWQP